jgi:hypothetical protein
VSAGPRPARGRPLSPDTGESPYAGDGSLTVVLQHDPPSDDELPTWLPTPAGDFRPILWLNQPRQAVFDGSYVLPPVTRR